MMFHSTTTATTTITRIPISEQDDCLDRDNEKPFRKRRRQRTRMRKRSMDLVAIAILSLVFLSSSTRQRHPREGALALLPRATTTTRKKHHSVNGPTINTALSADATTSPLFSNRVYKTTPTKFVHPIKAQSRSRAQRKENSRQNPLRISRSSVSPLHSPTALHMVLTTPQSIIEQASTVNLLDDLIDESVRTSARRPIMMQFDPSSGWIWRRWKGTVFAETWMSCGTFH